MAQVTVIIAGRKYELACDDGQEQHLTQLGDYLNRRASGLLQNVGQVSEPLLLAMASLLVTDELFDTRRELEQVRQAARSAATAVQLATNAQQDDVAHRIERLAARIEALAERLE